MKQNIIIILLSAICAILGYIAAQISNEPEKQQQTQIVAASPVAQPNQTPTQSITTDNNPDEIIDGGIIKPIKMPKYTKESLDNGEEGNIYIEIIVEKNSKVSTARVAKSSGYPRLDNNALKSAKLETYALATSKGEPMRTRYYVKYTFRLPE